MLRRSRGAHAVHGTESTRCPDAGPRPLGDPRGTDTLNVTSASPLGSFTVTGGPLRRPSSRTSLATASASSDPVEPDVLSGPVLVAGLFLTRVFTVCVLVTVHLLGRRLAVGTDCRRCDTTHPVDASANWQPVGDSWRPSASRVGEVPTEPRCVFCSIAAEQDEATIVHQTSPSTSMEQAVLTPGPSATT